MQTARILIIDDELNLSHFLREALLGEGFEVKTAERLEAARRKFDAWQPDLLLLDVMLPDGNGLDYLKELRQRFPALPVILMTAYGSINQAVEAMKAGADSYIAKPFELEEIRLKIEEILSRQNLRNQLNYFRNKEIRLFDQAFYLCQSETMQRVYRLVQKVAGSGNTHVLVEGESGTGKEMIARMLHKFSPRAEAPLVDINCASIPENLLESELFGYEPGAFTGATRRKAGLLEIASGGTLLLDEISELPLLLQAKLLRVLETQTIRRLGGVRDIRVNFRLIALTNQDLQGATRKGTFREDLYFRLRVIPIEIPPLREHPNDIPALADFFLQQLARQIGRKQLTFTEEALQDLQNYSWPGNIRELKNVIERAVVLCETQSIGRDLLFLSGKAVDTAGFHIHLPPEGLDLNEVMLSLQNQLIGEALRRCKGNQAQAAQLLRVPRHVVRYYLQKQRNKG